MAIPYPTTPILDWLGFRLGVTPVIPKFYFDAYSQEEIIKELSKELDSLAKYAQYLGTEMNVDRTTINNIAQTLNELQAGGWFEEYEDIIKGWIEDIQNIEAIVAEQVTAAVAPISGRVSTLETEVGGISDDLTDVKNALTDEVAARREADAEASTAIQALNSATSLESMRALIPSTLHEAQARVRIPVSIDTSDLEQYPEGGCPFGSSVDSPEFWATYLYHSVDTTNGPETIGNLQVYRISDQAKVFELAFDGGHGVNLAWDIDRQQLILTEWRRNMTTLSNRVFTFDYDATGALTYTGVYTLPFNRLGSCGPYKEGKYFAWVPTTGTSSVYVADTLSEVASDWTLLFTFNQSEIKQGGQNQTMNYAPALDLFIVTFSYASMALFIEPDGGFRRAMNIDGALGWIATEELQSIQVIGDTIYINNGCLKNTAEPWLNIDTYATMWSCKLGETRNLKQYAAVPNYEWTITVNKASTDNGLPFINTTATDSGIGTVRFKFMRDLIAMQFYPYRKNVVLQSKGYEAVPMSLINAGICRIQITGASLTNSNLAESLGGIYISGDTVAYPFQVPATFTINNAAVANWKLPRLSSDLKTFFRLVYGGTLWLQAGPSTVTRTTADAHTFASVVDSTLLAPAPPTTYIAGTRANIQTVANY